MPQDVSQLRSHETMHKFNRHTTRENDTCCVQQIHTLRPTRRGQNATKIMLTASRVTVRRIQTQDPRFSALLLGVSIACSSPILQSRWPINSNPTAAHVSVASRDSFCSDLASYGSQPVEYSESLTSLPHAVLQVGRTSISLPHASLSILSGTFSVSTSSRVCWQQTPYLLVAAYQSSVIATAAPPATIPIASTGGNSISFVLLTELSLSRIK